MSSYYELDYVLTPAEIYTGLKKSGLYKTSGKRAVIETILLAAMGIAFLVTFIVRRNPFDIAMFAVCCVVVFALNFLPRHDMKKQAKKGEDTLKLRVYSDRLYVYTKKESIPIELSGNAKVTHLKADGLFVVLPQGGGALIVPERAIPDDDRAAIFKRLLNRQEGHGGT